MLRGFLFGFSLVYNVLACAADNNLLRPALAPCPCPENGPCICKDGCQCEHPPVLHSVLKVDYGAPQTLAPLSDTRGNLAAIDLDHKSPQQTKTARPASTQAAIPAFLAAPSGHYERVYLGTSCGAGACTAQYGWQWIDANGQPTATMYQNGTYQYGMYQNGQAGSRGGPVRRIFRPLKRLFGCGG